MHKINYVSATIAVIGLSLALSGNSFADESPGEELFESMKCQKCHTPAKDKRAPSLITIASEYPDTETMVLYFSGKSEAIVEPKRARTMKSRLKKIIKLSDDDKKILASHIMSFKKTP